MKTKRVNGVFYRQLKSDETIRRGDWTNCNRHGFTTCGGEGRQVAEYVSVSKPCVLTLWRECEPMIAAMIKVKEK